MAQTILLKRRTTDATAPTTSDLAVGEIAVNAFSGKLYVRKTNGTVAEISGTGGGGGGDVGLIPSATFKRFEYTATNGQTTFSGNDNASQSLLYVAGNILVYLNGVLLDDTVDYVATSTTSVVLQDGATTNDLLTIISYNKNIGTGNTTISTFSGNGSTTAFTLAADPETENNTRVYIDGIYQSKSNYSVSGTTLTFSTAPPSGTAIEVEIGNREVSTSGITEMTISGDLTVDTNTLKVDSSNNRVGVGTASPSTALQVAGTVTATAFAGALTGNVTGNVSGTAGSATGNAATATALQNARTIHGVSFDGTANIDLTEVVQDTTGGMFTSNTETGITATYQDSDGTVDLVVDAAQTGITSLLATDIKIGEDDQTKIDFETADEIHFYAANAEQVYVADGILGPQTDSDVDLGSSGVRFKDAYVDTLTTTGALTVGGNLTVNGTTTTVNSTVTTVDDPVFTIGGDSAPGSDDNKDRGIEFRWHNGSAAKVGFFGYDDSASVFTFVPDATNSSEVFSGTAGNVSFGSITGTGLTIDTSTLVVDASNNRVGIGNASPDVSLDIGSYTDAMHVPVGTTAQRPGSPAAGYFRYNTTTGGFEGYTTEWGAIAGGGGGGDNTFTTDNFTGNGSATAFTLSQSISDEDNLIVFEEGIYQNKGDYTLSGTTLTFDEAPANGRKITVFSVRHAVAGSNLNQNSFTGNGSTAAYTLSTAPISENNTQVFLDGVYQHKSTYSTSGTTLTFDTNVPNGTAIEVMVFTQTDINVPVDNTITTAKIVDDAVTTAKIADDAVGNDQLASGLTLGGTTALTTLTASGTGTIGGNGTSGGVIISDGSVAIKTGTGSVAAVDFYCETNNAHRVRLKAPAHATFSGNPDVTLPNYAGTVVAVPSSGDMTIDAPADIILDADGGDTRFRDGGAGFFTISNSSLDAVLKVEQSNEDMLFKGNDGGSEITALTLDMSEAGAATFNSTVKGPNGTVSAPTYGFTNDTDCGMFLSSTGYLALTVAGTKSLEIGGGIIYTATNGKIRSAASAGSLELSGGGGEVGGQILLRGGAGDADIILKTSSGSTSATERMRIRTDGNVGIGSSGMPSSTSYRQLSIGPMAHIMAEHTSGAGKSLHISQNAHLDADSSWETMETDEASNYYQHAGGHYWRGSASTSAGTDITWSRNMVFNANGQLIVGKTTDNVGTIGFLIASQGGCYSSINSSVYNTYHYYDTNNSAYKFYVGGNGQVNAAFTSIASISDARLKENVRDYTVGLNDLLKLKPRVFDWKEKQGKNIKNDVGFIAQEFEEVFPDWINKFLHDDLEDAKSVAAGELIFPMVNAIKELKAEIDALKEKLSG